MSKGAKKTSSAGGLAMLLTGEATAVGTDTVAAGSLSGMDVVDKGPVRFATGTIITTATAQSTDGSLVYATADTFGTVEGADVVITKTRTFSDTDDSGGQTTTTQTSITTVRALDIEHLQLPHGGVVHHSSAKHGGNYEPGQLDGNVALLGVDAHAIGENTYVGVDASVLTVEDQLSTVSLSAIIAVD